MRAVAVFPGQRQVRLVEHPAPEITAPGELKIRTLEVGVCGTDREICTFVYGSPPANFDYLVLGHEALGEVVEVGRGVSRFKPGDLVVPSVRRPCSNPNCSGCRSDRQDFCFTGDFTERGIKMTHGFMTDYFVEEERHLSIVPRELRDVAVLVEPLTVAEKALAQVWQVQERLPLWAPPTGAVAERGRGRNAVVLGAGPVGILGAMMLVANGFKTYVYSRSLPPNPKAQLVESFGVPYISALAVSAEELADRVGNIDLVYEAIGVAATSFKVLKVLGTNGAFVFTGIPAPNPAISVEADQIMRNLVLKNQLVFGTVNADRAAFEAAIRDLGIFQQRWPHALKAIFTGRFPMDACGDLLLAKQRGIKNVITIG